MAQATGLLYLKAAHSETAAVQPADITIYMGGTSGYEGVAKEDGTISGSSSLPKPGCSITLPDSVNVPCGQRVSARPRFKRRM